MKYTFNTWTLAKLLKRYDEGKINLMPPYQRNDIWTEKQQKHLLDTIENKKPFPNFFLHFSAGKYEMVDGQQRSRTIIGFLKDKIKDKHDHVFSNLSAIDRKSFRSYKISVSIITDLAQGETMEDYYVLVNSTGARLNRPELIKAEHHKSPFLKLIQDLSENPFWLNLELFTERSMDRMNDMDFIGELLALVEYGPSDKKEKVDELLEAKLSQEKINTLEKQFLAVLSIFGELNKEAALKNTRYRQRNDFYTLFQFINNHMDISLKTYTHYYGLLRRLGLDISPSLEDCEPLKEYALNCVSQSNSKSAREARYKFLTELFLNEIETPNAIQLQIMSYFQVTEKI